MNSYVTLLTSDSYVQGVLLLKETLRKTNTKYPLLCLVTESISKNVLDILKKANINYRLVETVPTPDIIYEHNLKISKSHANLWKDTFTKFQLWTLIEYDKIIYLDADLLILKNLDHCFNMPVLTAAQDGEYFKIWPKVDFFNSGFFVLEPDAKVFKELVTFLNTLDPTKLVNYLGQQRIVADQDVLNEFFSEWQTNKTLHLGKYYNVFAPYIQKEHEQDLLENCYFIHFIGVKPWHFEGDVPNVLECTKTATKSYLFYIYAFAIIYLSYTGDFKDLDWTDLEQFNCQVAKFALNNYKDTKIAIDYANRLSDKETKNLILSSLDLEDKREILLKILKYYFKKQEYTNAYLFEEYARLQVVDEAVDKWWKLIDNVINSQFINC